MPAHGRHDGPNVTDDRPAFTPVKQAQLPEAVAATLKRVREAIGSEARPAWVVAYSLRISRFSIYHAQLVHRVDGKIVAVYDVSIDYDGKHLRTRRVR